MGHKDPRGKGSNMKIRTRNLAGTETELLWKLDSKKNGEGNSPCLRAKAPGDKRSHVVPVKRQKRGSQCRNTRLPVVEHWYRVEMKGFSTCPCQTLPSSYKSGLGVERQCRQQW